MSEEQPKNPLHGLTLEAILVQLHEAYGWEKLSEMVKVQCFANDPSVASSLKFLRRTPWAREKVESLYLWEYRKNKARAPGTEGTQSHTLGCKDSRARDFRGSGRGRRGVVAASVVFVRSVGDAVGAPLRSPG